MSKIGEKPIEFDAAKVTVTVEKGGEFDYLTVTVKGPKGDLKQDIAEGVKIEVADGTVTVTRESEETEDRSLHGLYRSLIANMVDGVVNGYEKRLEIHGVGFRGTQKGTAIEMNLGFSHPVTYHAPEDVTVTMEGQEVIIVTGIDKQRVGQVAAEIRDLRKPEPYKGKGIRYMGENIKRKAGKAGVAG